MVVVENSHNKVKQLYCPYFWYHFNLQNPAGPHPSPLTQWAPSPWHGQFPAIPEGPAPDSGAAAWLPARWRKQVTATPHWALKGQLRPGQARPGQQHRRGTAPTRGSGPGWQILEQQPHTLTWPQSHTDSSAYPLSQPRPIPPAQPTPAPPITAILDWKKNQWEIPGQKYNIIEGEIK